MKILRERPTACLSRGYLWAFLLVITCTWHQDAWAYQFTLEEHEWAVWPEYCKARYVTTGIGKQSSFRDKVPNERIEYWRQRTGEDAFVHLHHYCAGVLWLQRAQRGWRNRPKGELLDRAIKEASYTYQRIGPDDQLASIVASTLSSALLEKGDNEAAESILTELITHQPGISDPYVAGAIVYHRAGRLDTALALLNRGEDAANAPSAELYYIKGLILADLERYPEAAEYANLAYSNGYPLFGLQKRLEAKGYSVDRDP